MTNAEEHIRKNLKKLYVQTPPEVIDFIENSIDDIIKEQFGKSGINAEDVEIIDPFAGHAEFTTRGIDTGLITPETAGRITHMEILPESVALAKKYLKQRGVKNPIVKNVDTMEETKW